MPLTMAEAGKENVIKRITGRDDARRFLASLGFVEGESITVVSRNRGNMILTIKDARIALDQSMASRIIV